MTEEFMLCHSKDRISRNAKAIPRQLRHLTLLLTAMAASTAWANDKGGLAKPADTTSAMVKTAPALSPAPLVYEKTYTKEELNKKMPPNPAFKIGDWIMQEVTTLLNRMAANQSGSSQKAKTNALKSKEPTKNQYLDSLAAMKSKPATTGTDGEALREFLNSEMQLASSAQVKAKVGFLKTISSGLSFNLGVDNPRNPKEGSAAPSQVRYDLILEDVVPDERAPKRAAISDVGDELQYAGRADIKWTIGPVTEEKGRKIFNIREKTDVGQDDTEPSLWRRVRVPKAAFKGRITPYNFDKIAAVQEENMPQWKIEAGQSEDYYTLTYMSKTSGEKISEEHAFRLPLVGAAAIGRRFDDRFRVIETSAYNILVNPHLPLVSIHHLNLEERYRGELGFAFGEKKARKLKVTATGHGNQTIKDQKKREKKIDFSYEHDF